MLEFVKHLILLILRKKLYGTGKHIVAIIVGIAVGVPVGLAILWGFSLIVKPVVEVAPICQIFPVSVHNEVGMSIIIGQIELCDGEWSNIWGPIGADKPEKVIPRGIPQGIWQ